MQCHAVPQPPPISGRSPEKELCFRTKQERETHQDSVCVCVCVCVCARARMHAHVWVYTHVRTGIRAGWEDKKVPHFSPMR